MVQESLSNIGPERVHLLETLGKDRDGHWALFDLITLPLFCSSHSESRDLSRRGFGRTASRLILDPCILGEEAPQNGKEKDKQGRSAGNKPP